MSKGIYKVGGRFKISPDNDNDSYDAFRDKVLIVTHSSNSGPFYDESMYPQNLMDFKTEDGEEFPFALYEYEVESI